jgi:polar amino acid transport system substrate-binding protein
MPLGIAADVLADLALTGKLRAGVNYSNFVLATKDPATGEPRGIAPDLARQIAQQLKVPIEFVTFETAGKMADAVTTGAWDIAFLANEPERANEILFTPPYLEIDAGYLVPPGSAIRDFADIDRSGIRIVIAVKSAYDLFLSRTLRHATLVRAQGMPGSYEMFLDQKLDVLAGIKPWLSMIAGKLRGSRILDGHFMSVQQCIGTPRGREAGAKFLREFVEELKKTSDEK